jgi:hypothetical protein
MPDYSFLMGAKPVELPNPLDLATKGVSLAGLMQNVDMNALTLQQKQQMMALFKDPRYVSMLSSMIAPGGGNAGQLGGGPGSAPAAPGGSADLSVLSDYPAAAPDALQGILKMKIEGAQAYENTQRGLNYQQDVLDKRLAKTAEAANAVMQNPTAQTITAYVHAHAFTGAAPDAFGTPPSTMDPKAWGDYASNVYASLSDPKVRAETAKMLVETKLAPQKVAIEQQQADTASKAQALKQAEYYKGEAVQDPDSKQWFVKVPNPNGVGFTIINANTGQVQLDKNALPLSPADRAAAQRDAAATGAASPTEPSGAGGMVPLGTAGAVPTSPSGAPVTGPDFKAKELFKSAVPEVEHLTAQSNAASTMKAMIEDLRKGEAQGIFSGGIAGTEFFRKVANIAAATGALSTDQVNKLANTQAWTAETGNLVAQAVSQFAGSRVAAREIPFFQGVKPETLQTPEGREKLYQSLWNISSRVQQTAAQAGQHLAKNPSLLGFAPQFKDEKLPPIQLDALPNARTWPAGKALQDDSGNIWRAVGGKWQNTGKAPAPGLADQVPQ